MARRIRLRLRRHGEQHDAGIAQHFGFGGIFQRIGKRDAGQCRIMHAIGLQVGHQRRIAAEQRHVMAIFQRNHHRNRRAEGTGTDDDDGFALAHALAPTLAKADKGLASASSGQRERGCVSRLSGSMPCAMRSSPAQAIIAALSVQSARAAR